MLFKLTGSSCSGKTTLAFAVAERLQGVVVHDFDEVGVPADADVRWRHRATEHWVRCALEYQDRGLDLLLTGQSPLGEVLAAPSAPLLDGIALCLVDVADEVRRHRLTARDGGRWDAPAVDRFLNWAAWHRGHARDPRHRPNVLTTGAWLAPAGSESRLDGSLGAVRRARWALPHPGGDPAPHRTGLTAPAPAARRGLRP